MERTLIDYYRFNPLVIFVTKYGKNVCNQVKAAELFQ